MKLRDLYIRFTDYATGSYRIVCCPVCGEETEKVRQTGAPF
mgnify:CR=1 FL=1